MAVNVKTATCESADKILESFIADLDFDTCHHRIGTQDIKCGFGLQGFAVSFVPMVPAGLHLIHQRGYVGLLQTLLWQGTS